MSDQSSILQLLAETKALRGRGRKMISLAELQIALEAAARADEAPSAASQTAARAPLLASNDERSEIYGRMIEGSLSLASEILRSVMLIHGGAVIALLSFVGTETAKPIRAALGRVLLIFCIGIVTSALATGTAYLTQYCWTEQYWRKGNLSFWATVAFIVSSIGVFAFGAYRAYLAIVSLP